MRDTIGKLFDTEFPYTNHQWFYVNSWGRDKKE